MNTIESFDYCDPLFGGSNICCLLFIIFKDICSIIPGMMIRCDFPTSLPQLVLAALLGRFVADRLGRVDMQLGVAFSGQQEDFWLDQ